MVELSHHKTTDYPSLATLWDLQFKYPCVLVSFGRTTDKDFSEMNKDELDDIEDDIDEDDEKMFEMYR